VASRFRTYLPDLALYRDDGTAQAYVEAIFAMPEIAEWESGARQQVEAAKPAGKLPARRRPR
jgi:glutathione S-transferase